MSLSADPRRDASQRLEFAARSGSLPYQPAAETFIQYSKTQDKFSLEEIRNLDAMLADGSDQNLGPADAASDVAARPQVAVAEPPSLEKLLAQSVCVFLVQRGATHDVMRDVSHVC